MRNGSTHARWFAAGLFVTCVAAATTESRAQSSPVQTATPAPSPGSVLRDAEQAYVVQLVESGRDEADLARTAAGQAGSTETRELARQIASDLSSINRSLENLARRKQLALPIQPTSLPDDQRKLATLAGGDFDRAFAREINRAAQRSLRLCEGLLANARDEDVRALAGGMLPILRDHANKTTALESGS